MMSSNANATFKQEMDLSINDATLIEGMPGHGLVAAIAVDQITEQLDLNHLGSIASDTFPPVATYDDGLVQELVRIHGSESPSVLTLKSDLALPHESFGALSSCILEDLSEWFDRAVFLAGAPAQSEEQLGEVFGIGTTESIKQDLRDADITVPEDPGLVGGITGAFVRECHQHEIPAALLVVRAHPYLPDPQAAKAVIETALEPLVEFNIDTTPLDEQAEEIQQRMEQIAAQYQSLVSEQEEAETKITHPGMFQ